MLNPRDNSVDMTRAAEKILVAEYEATRSELSQDPRSIDLCTFAMRRLRVFLTDHEIPCDILQKIEQSGESAPHGISAKNLERYHLTTISNR
jgi:hypothetical protein